MGKSVDDGLTTSSAPASFERRPPTGGRDVLPSAEGLDLVAFARLFEDGATSYKHLFFRALLEEFRNGGFTERVFPLARLAIGMLASAWYPCRVHRLSFGPQDQVAKVLACIDFVGDAEPPAAAIRKALSTKRMDVRDLTRVVPYRLIAPFFAAVLRRVPDHQRNGLIRRLANQDFETARPLYRFVDRDDIEMHAAWAEYIAANFGSVSAWAERQWVAYLQSRNPLASALWNKIGPPAAPPASGIHLSPHELSEAGEEGRVPRLFPPTTVEALDLATAQAAVDALSKRGFDRVRAYREVRRAYEYLEGLGYSGPKEEAEAHLQELIDRHWEIGASTSTAPNLEPSLEWKDGSDFEEPGDAVRPFEGGSAEPEGLASEAHRTPSPTVADLLNWADISVRLFNVSRISGLFGEWTISEALARRGEFLAGVLRVTNAGAKTVSEVSRLLDDVRDRPNRSSCSPCGCRPRRRGGGRGRSGRPFGSPV